MSSDLPVDLAREELERHGAWLRRLARGLLYDRASADDLVQAAWLAALRRGPIEGTQRAWLAGTVRLLARQTAREGARRARRERAAARPEALDDASGSLERLELTQLLVEAVRALDEPYRTALLWHFFDGLSVREIARRREVPLETARTHVKRGLELVRRRLDAGRVDRRAELLGALVPLAGPMPFALQLGRAGVAKTILKGAGVMGAGGKLGLVVVGAVAVAIALWSLRASFGERAAEPALGSLAREEASTLQAGAAPASALERAPDAPTRSAAGNEATEDAAAPIDEVPRPAVDVATLAGRVHDPEGQPIAGARVLGGSGEVLTDADGRYRIEFATARPQVHIEVKAAGWSQTRQVVGALRLGEVTELDVELRRELRVVGRVEDEYGNPIEGAEVSSFYTHGNEATSALDGSYTLGSLDPGRPEHMITARKEGFVRTSETIETRGRDEIELVLRLTRGVRVEGFVRDEGGAPVVGAELYIGFSPHAYDRLDAVADEQGAFAFPVVARGAQTLVTQHAGFAPDSRQILVPEEGEVLGGLEVVLSSGHYVAGRVLDEQDAPLAGVRISVLHHDEYIRIDTSTDADGHFRLEHLPDSEVSLELSGQGLLRFRHPVAELDTDDLVLHMQRGAHVAGTVVDGPTGAPLASFRIRFVEPVLADGDQRAWGYSATWSREGHLFNASDGRWVSDEADLPVGAVIGIEASAPGYGPAVAERVVAAVEPDPAACVLVLWPECVVRGVVLSRLTGEAVAGALVKRFTEREPLRQNDADDVHGRLLARTDAHGRFELRGVPVGSMSLAIEHAQFTPAIDGPFDVPGGGPPVERAIELGAGASVSGRVLDAEGRALASELVQLEARPGSALVGRKWEFESGPDGAFRFERIPPGSFTLAHVLRDPRGMRVHSIGLALELATDEQHAPVELRPRGNATIHGGLSSDTSLPGEFAIRAEPVRAEGTISGQMSVRGTLTTDGRFELRGLEPGEYRITAARFDTGTSANWLGLTQVRVEAGERAEAWITVAAH